ncbi:unnamed protein product [Mytilus coruscus]|uniref:Uncharacterized protein n=1 Tax=Mytilus coruscus TaxID=42192 RepID=A0A6J8BMY9_MYTCO|nr:unnamed protein product [Mytilus coruscus]
MFPYERLNHTLTAAVSNNQYPELSAIEKVERICAIDITKIVWLIKVPLYSEFSNDYNIPTLYFFFTIGAVVDHFTRQCWFFPVLNKVAAKVNKQRSAGRFKPEIRHLTTDELPHLKDFYQSEIGEMAIAIYHYASNKKGPYRDVFIEKPTQREQCSVVTYNNCVGKIRFFFENCTNELL